MTARRERHRVRPEPDRPSAAEGPIRILFDSFEQELLDLTPAEVLDPTVQRALEALGYAR